MDESFGEWWWCPECGEPIEVCASYGTCPNSQISKSHVAAEQSVQRTADMPCEFCGLSGGKHDIEKHVAYIRSR